MHYDPGVTHCIAFILNYPADKHEEVVEIKRVTVHFEQIALLSAEIVIKVDESMSMQATKELAIRLQSDIKKEIDVIHAEIHLDLGSEDYAAKNTDSDSSMADMPPFNSRGQAQVNFAGI